MTKLRSAIRDAWWLIRWPFCAVLLYIVKFLVILDAGWDRYVAWRKGESAE